MSSRAERGTCFSVAAYQRRQSGWKAACLALLSLLLVPPAIAQNAGESAQQAAEALQKEDYATAAKALEAYLAQNPQDYRAQFNLALSYSMTARPSDAIRLYRQIITEHSDLVPARVNLGILLLDAGDAAGALEQFDKVLAQQPDHWAAQVNRAAALVALQRLPEAREAYEKALALKPDHAATHLAYAKVLSSTDTALAEQHLRRALELDPSLQEAMLLLAAVLEERAAHQPSGTTPATPGQPGADPLTEASEIYRKFLASQPDSNQVRARLGEIYLEQKRYADAIQELEAVRAAGQADAAANDALLRSYLGAKLNDKAMALLPELLAQPGANSDLYLLQGRLFLDKRQYPDAAKAFRRASELQPDSPEGFTNLASALYLMKDYPATVAALQRVSALGKDTAGTYFLRAITLEKLGQKRPALENYQKFLALDEKKNPDQEFQARQRSKILARELKQNPRH
jgi:tetratricopeptide (TPR) repeat protein